MGGVMQKTSVHAAAWMIATTVIQPTLYPVISPQAIHVIRDHSMECGEEEGIFKVQRIRVSIKVYLSLNTLFVHSCEQTLIIVKAEHINIKTDRPRYAFFPDPKPLVWPVNHDFYGWTGLGSVIRLKPSKDDAAGSAALLGAFCEVLIVLMGEGR
jgi:hypothetical protein